MRRSALPSVWPKPRSRGSAPKVAKRADRSPSQPAACSGRINSCQFFGSSLFTHTGHPFSLGTAGVEIAGKSAHYNFEDIAKARCRPRLATSNNQTRRRLRGRQPLRIVVTSADRGDGEARRLQRAKRRFTARTGASTSTSSVRMPCSLRLLGDVFTATCAA